MTAAAIASIIGAVFRSNPKSGSYRRMTAGLMDLGPDALVVLVPEEDRADDDRDERDNDRKREPCVDVARLRHQARGDDGKKSTEPAVAEMVRQRERRIADLGRKCFDEESGDRPVHH